MRVRSIHVGRWRNLVDVHIDVPPEARLICLVGENGTGKSSILELLTWSAHQLGLAMQAPLRRRPPQLLPGTPFHVEVTLTTERVDALRDALRTRVGTPADSWDGDVTLTSRSWAGESLPAIPPGIGYSSDTTGGSYTAILAGRVEPGSAAAVGAHIVELVRSLPELLHLYIDAERVFPQMEVQDAEVLALARQDPDMPDWLKSQAAQATQNLYIEWMRSILGRQQRLQTEYFQEGLRAGETDSSVPPPADPLASYRQGLNQVLPHLRFIRLDQEARRLIFDSAGTELPYEELSGGERELAFLIGQIDRFGLRDGLFLLDEPELHLNPELLRSWLDYLRSTIDKGQAWVATHALEAAEVTGPSATLVLERADDRLVHAAPPLADRPALSTLAAALGTPAFSVARSRFVLIEGTRARRERERFATVLESEVSDRFIEAGGCTEVIAMYRGLRELASEEEQLRVAAVLDRDFRTDDERTRLLEEQRIHVLSVHEIENLFLQPALLERLLLDAGREAAGVAELLCRTADPDAGRWAFEKTRAEENWGEDARPSISVAGQLDWAAIEPDPDSAARAISETIPGIAGSEVARRRIALRERLDQYRELRADADRLSRGCFGKEVLIRVARELGYRDASGIESRAAVLWHTGSVARPSAAVEIRHYLDSVPVLRG